MFKVKSILVVTIILCSYLFFTNPDGMVINEEGKIEGLFNKGRANLQKGKFWMLQFERVNKKYKENLFPSESMSSQMQEIDQNLRDIDKEIDDKTKELYTPEELIAQSLRREADRIEKQGTYRKIDEWVEKDRLETIEDCKIIIPIIEAKIHDVKPSYTTIFLLICVLLFALLAIITKYQKNHKRPKIILNQTV